VPARCHATGDGGKAKLMSRVFIGVDPHKLSATIQVVDDRETVSATSRFATDKAEHAAMRRHGGWTCQSSVSVGDHGSLHTAERHTSGQSSLGCGPLLPRSRWVRAGRAAATVMCIDVEWR
jgi:hypothetical protein